MPERPNILLITIDTLRADHLGCYGYHRPTSPRMDALAREGVLCEGMFASAIPTHPSYTTLSTGLHAMTHEVVAQSGSTELASTRPWLAEILLKAGYTTAAFDNLMRERQWFGRGFEFYVDSSLHRVLSLGITCEELNSRAIPWMRHHADEPFFMFLHYWDPHSPYLPPERYRQLFYSGNPTDPDNHLLDEWWNHPLGTLARDTWLRTSQGVVTDPEYVVALYDQEIRHLDDGIEALLDELDSLGLSDRTMVALVSDHGESMTEHGIFFEHHGLYDCTTRLPMIFRWPERIPDRVRLPHLFQMEDLAPTLLDAAGVSIPSVMEGRSFWNLLTQEEKEGGRERVISLECTLQAKWCIRTKEHKFIVARKPDYYGTPLRELYDLVADPGEEKNIIDERPEIASALESELDAWIAERLRALGREKDPLIEQEISMKAVMDS